LSIELNLAILQSGLNGLPRLELGGKKETRAVLNQHNAGA
jgi:hypothetical protein